MTPDMPPAPQLQADRPSAAMLWPPIARFVRQERRLAAWAGQQGPAVSAAYEFLRFGVKQGWACLFGALLLGLITATHLWYPAGAALARYDVLVLGAVAIQVAMLALRLESVGEARIILIFHMVGTSMELFKIATGSWTYPEASLLRIGGVPLFTGFMYAAIGSYLARVWRLLDFRFTRHPGLGPMAVLSVGIYLNFFADHYGVDIRIALLAAIALLFGRTTIYFKPWRAYRRMNLLLGFVLVALFIWIAENIGTATGAWIYPSQIHHWSMVPITKLESWLMLMIVSYTLTALVTRPAPMAAARQRADLPA